MSAATEAEEFEFRLRAEQEASTPAPAAPVAEAPPQEPGFLEKSGLAQFGRDLAPLNDLPGVGTAQMIGQGGTRFVGKILSGLAGLFGGDVEGIQSKVNSATELPPSNDPILKGLESVANVAGKVTAPVDQAIENSDNPLVQYGVKPGIEAVTDLAALTPLGPEAAAARTAKAAKAAARPQISPAVGKAVDQEYRLRPTDVRANSPGADVPGVKRERLHNPAELKKETILHNQQVTTSKAGSDLGLDKATRLDEDTLKEARKPHNAVYDAAGTAAGKFKASEAFGADLAAAVKSVPPDMRVKVHKIAKEYAADQLNGPELITNIRVLRNRATRGIQSKVVAEQEIGFANRRVADALEAELGRRLEGGGDGKLFKQFQESRTSLAKINNVADATYGGQVDAQVLAKLKERGVPLTGHLKDIADTAQEFKHVMQHSSKTASGGLPKAESLTSVVKDVGAAAIRKIPGMDVASEGFNRKMGAKAERPKTTMRDVPPEVVPPQLGAGDVEFEKPPVQPSLASQLAGDLELMPEPVANPQQLPPAPPMMTAETPAPIRGDIDFEPSAPTLAQQLAGDLELQHSAAPGPDSIEWSPPNLSDMLSGGQQLAPSNIIDELVAQLGLDVNQGQAPLLRTPDMPDPTPRPSAMLEPPPGRVGKPKKSK